MPFVFEEEAKPAVEGPRYVLEPKPGIIQQVKDVVSNLAPPKDALKNLTSSLSNIGQEFTRMPAGASDVKESVNNFVRDPLGSINRLDQSLKERFPETTATLNRLREGLTPDLTGAAEAIRQVPAESQRLSDVMKPVFGRSAEAIAPYVAGARSLMAAPLMALTPKVANEVLSPALHTVSETAGTLSTMAGLPKPITNLVKEFSPDAVMVGLPVAFHKYFNRPMQSRADVVKAVRESPQFVETLKEQLKASKLAEDAGFTTGKTGSAPEVRTPAVYDEAQGRFIAPGDKPWPRFEVEQPKPAEALNAKTQSPEVKAPVSEVVPPVVEAGKAEAAPVLTAPEVVAKIESQQNPEFFDKPKIEKQVEKGGDTYVKVEVDPTELKTRKGVEPGLSVPDKGPVVVDAGGKVIDGNHRAVDAKAAGEKAIEAYVPGGSKLAESASLNQNAKPIAEMSMDELLAAAEGVKPVPIKTANDVIAELRSKPPSSEGSWDRSAESNFRKNFSEPMAKLLERRPWRTVKDYTVDAPFSRTQRASESVLRSMKELGDNVEQAYLADGTPVYGIKGTPRPKEVYSPDEWTAKFETSPEPTPQVVPPTPEVAPKAVDPIQARVDALEAENAAMRAKVKPQPEAQAAPAPKVPVTASEVYDASLARFRQASQEFNEITKAYRAKEIGDNEFLAGRKKFDEAKALADKAETEFIERTNAAAKPAESTKSLTEPVAPAPFVEPKPQPFTPESAVEPSNTNPLLDSMGQKHFWAKTRKEITQEGIEGVKELRRQRADVNKLKGSEGYASWRLRSSSTTLKNDIASKQEYYKGLLEVHKDRVVEALAEGKPVPPEVIKDYPDLAREAAKAKAAERVAKAKGEPVKPETPAEADGELSLKDQVQNSQPRETRFSNKAIASQEKHRALLKKRALEAKPVEATPAVAEVKIERGIEKARGAKEQVRVKNELATRLQALLEKAPTNADLDAQAKAINATAPKEPTAVYVEGKYQPTDPKVKEAYTKDREAWDKKHGPELDRLEKGTITIDIPGDGTFKIRRTQEALTELLQRVKRLETNVPKDIRNQPQRAIPIPKRRGEMAADIWYESSDPSHWVTNSTGVKLKGMPIEVPGIDTPLYVTSGGETYWIVEPKTGLALGEEASSIAKAVANAQSAYKAMQAQEVAANKPVSTMEQVIKRNLERGDTKAKVEEITPESLAEFEKAREIPEQYKPKVEEATPVEPTKPGESVDAQSKNGVTVGDRSMGTAKGNGIRRMLEEAQKKGEPAWSDSEFVYTRKGKFQMEDDGTATFLNELSDDGIFRNYDLKQNEWQSTNDIASSMAQDRAVESAGKERAIKLRQDVQNERIEKWRSDKAQRESDYLDELDAKIKATKFGRGSVEIQRSKGGGGSEREIREGAILTEHFAIRKPDNGIKGWIIDHRNTGLKVTEAETIQQAKRIAVALEGLPNEVGHSRSPWAFTESGKMDGATAQAAGEIARNLKGRGTEAPESFKPIAEPPYKVGEKVVYNEYRGNALRGKELKAVHDNAKVEKVYADGSVDIRVTRRGGDLKFGNVSPEELELPRDFATKPDLSKAPLSELVKKGLGTEKGTIGKLTQEESAAESTARAARQEIYRRVKVEAEKAGETIEEAAERLKLPAGMLARLKSEQEAPPAPPAAAPAPSEPPKGEFVTSIKNVQVDKELAEMGKPPATHGERVTFEMAREEAARTMKADPFAGQKLVNDLVGKPRPATAFEDALLLHEQTRLKNERLAAEDRLIAAQKSGDATAISEAKARVEAATADFMTISDVVTQVGTESSLSLGHRRMMMKEDYSLASMERAKQIANEGKPLTEVQRAEVKALYEKINATQKSFDDYVAGAQKQRADLESELAHTRLLAEAKAKPTVEIEPHIKSLADRIVASLDAQADSARARLKSKLSSLHAGIDPTILSDMAIIGTAKIAKGAVEFAHWSKAMIDDLGEKIRPYLNEVWDASNKKLEDRINRMAGKSSEPVKRVIQKADIAERQSAIEERIKVNLEDGVHITDIARHVQVLAKIFVERGVTERDALIDAVHGTLKEIAPDVTRRQTMDLISGYGQYTQLSKDQLSGALRDLKGQMQQVAKLEDIQNRQPPLKTGVERRAVSDEERHLIQQVNEAKRRYGIVITDPETQLKSALGARKTYYENAISDLEAQIKSGEKFVKTTTPSPTDAELLKLKARHAELKGEFDEVFGKPEVTDAQRVAAATRGLERSIADLDERIKTGDISPRTPSKPISTPALEGLRARRDALQEQLQELRDIANPKKTPEERALQALKSRLKRQTADMLKRLESGDFSKRPRLEVTLDKEAQSLSFENAKIKEKWHEELMHDRLAHRTRPQKIIGTAGEILNTSRAILTSFDLSAVFRQGGAIVFGHPVRAARAFPSMFRALASEKGAYAVNQEILGRENYPLYQRSKLYLSEHGSPLSRMEEAYMSRWADKIPLVAGSQRAYTTFLNRIRADSFDALAKSIGRSERLTPEEAKVISNYVNVATGRGDIGMTGNALVGLNTVFFAPRYVASRFELLAGQPLYKGTARTRVAIAQEYARMLAGLGVVYGLAKMSGADVEADPRSSDFGKIKIGNTRVDPLMGMSQVTVLLSRLASGESKTLKGRIVELRGDKKKYGGSDSADVIGRFLRSKLSPAFGTAMNVASGKNVVGEKVTPESIATNLAIPLAMQDIYDAMQDQGVPKGTALGLLGIFGMSLQTFDAKKKRVNDRRTFAERWGFDQDKAVNE